MSDAHRKLQPATIERGQKIIDAYRVGVHKDREDDTTSATDLMADVLIALYKTYSADEVYTVFQRAFDHYMVETFQADE